MSNLVADASLHNSHPQVAIRTLYILRDSGYEERANLLADVLWSCWKDSDSISTVTKLKFCVRTENPQLVEDFLSSLEEPGIPNEFFRILHDEAIKMAVSCKNSSEALKWFHLAEASESKLDNQVDCSVKRQMNEAVCHLKLDHKEVAEQLLSSVIMLDGDCVKANLLYLKLTLERGDIAVATTCLKRLCHLLTAGVEGAPAAVLTASRLAFAANNRHLALMALDPLVKVTSSPKEVLVQQRCLVRLVLTTSDSQRLGEETLTKLAGYCELGTRVLTDADLATKSLEVRWFLFISWSIATHSACYPTLQRRSLVSTYTLANLLPGTFSTDIIAKCLVAVVESTMLLVRSVERNSDECRRIVQRALTLISKAHSLNATHSILQRPGRLFLLLSEFECHCRLLAKGFDTSPLIHLLEKAKEWTDDPVFVFEDLSRLLDDSTASCQNVCLTVWSLVFKRHISSPTRDVARTLRVARHLVTSMCRFGFVADFSLRSNLTFIAQNYLAILKYGIGLDVELEVFWFFVRCCRLVSEFLHFDFVSDAVKFAKISHRLARHLHNSQFKYFNHLNMVNQLIRTANNPVIDISSQ